MPQCCEIAELFESVSDMMHTKNKLTQRNKKKSGKIKFICLCIGKDVSIKHKGLIQLIQRVLLQNGAYRCTQ